MRREDLHASLGNMTVVGAVIEGCVRNRLADAGNKQGLTRAVDTAEGD